MKHVMMILIAAPVETEEEENPLLAALIAVSVVSVVIVTILSLLLARFVYLYLQRRKFRFGNGSYTKYEANGMCSIYLIIINHASAANLRLLTELC